MEEEFPTFRENFANIVKQGTTQKKSITKERKEEQLRKRLEEEEKEKEKLRKWENKHEKEKETYGIALINQHKTTQQEKEINKYKSTIMKLNRLINQVIKTNEVKKSPVHKNIDATLRSERLKIMRKNVEDTGKEQTYKKRRIRENQHSRKNESRSRRKRGINRRNQHIRLKMEFKILQNNIRSLRKNIILLKK